MFKGLLGNVVINLLCGSKNLKGSSFHKLFPEILMITEFFTQETFFALFLLTNLKPPL